MRAIQDSRAKAKMTIVKKIQADKQKERERERDFFCIVSDAFRVFARRSSIVLGSAWAFAGAVLVIARLADYRSHFSFFRHVATDHQHRHDHYHVLDGISDSEHAKPRRQSGSFEIGRTDSSNQRRTQ